MSLEVRPSERSRTSPRCPFCHEDVADWETVAVCSQCGALEHSACFAEGGGCAACREHGLEPDEPVGRVLPRRRPRRLRPWVAALALVACSIGALSLLRSDPVQTVAEPAPAVRPREAPAETATDVVTRYLQTVLGTPERILRDQARSCATEDTLAVLALEGPESERSSLGFSTLPRFMETEPASENAGVRDAIVRAGGQRFHVVDRGGLLVERVLADDQIFACGAALRPPVRLRATGWNTWRQGDLTLRIERAPFESFPEGDILVNFPFESAMVREPAVVRFEGKRAALFIGEGATESIALAFVDMGDGLLPLRYELRAHGRARPGAIARVARASLSTLRALEPAAAPGPLRRLEERSVSVRDPGGMPVTFRVSTPGGAALGQFFGGESVDVRLFTTSDMLKGWGVEDLPVYTSGEIRGDNVPVQERRTKLVSRRRLFEERCRVGPTVEERRYALVAWGSFDDRDVGIAVIARASAWDPAAFASVEEHLGAIVDSVRVPQGE